MSVATTPAGRGPLARAVDMTAPGRLARWKLTVQQWSHFIHHTYSHIISLHHFFFGIFLTVILNTPQQDIRARWKFISPSYERWEYILCLWTNGFISDIFRWVLSHFSKQLVNYILWGDSCQIFSQWIGLRENWNRKADLAGKDHGFRFRFSHKIAIDFPEKCRVFPPTFPTNPWIFRSVRLAALLVATGAVALTTWSLWPDSQEVGPMGDLPWDSHEQSSTPLLVDD